MPISSMPSGEFKRETYICDATAPLCPRCGQEIVGRSTVTVSGTLTTCLNRWRRPGEPAARSCGAKIFSLAVVGGLVKLVEVTQDEAALIVAGELTLRQLMIRLNLLVTRSA